ncbi:MAG: GWxTD domain-containing protein [Gemmatimonadaceae bacterium]
MRCAMLVFLLAAASLSAQSDTQEKRFASADSLVSEGDSVGALRLLDAAVRANQSDGEAWHRRGVLAWGMSGAEKRTGFMKRTANESLLNVADSSLRLATHYAPGSPGYLVDLGRFDLTSNSAATRGRARPLFEQALKSARKGKDPVVLSRAADEMGMTWWRHYEDIADRNIYSAIISNVKDRAFTKDPRSIAYFVDRQTIRAAAQDWSGALEYLKAYEFFNEALKAQPGNEAALKHVYGALVDRQRWVELEHIARVRLLDDHTDAWAWLSLGLGTHRLGDEHESSLAFDSALAYLPARERARVTNLSRIVTPKDSISRNRLPASELANDERMYWLMADPLWATPENEGRNEFLSRVVFAELRFSVEEFGIHGVDTDRGDVYVRYGPPPAVISFPPDAVRQGEHRIRILWWYSTDETFLFRQLPTYGVATLDPDDARETAKLRDTVPVAWTNAGAKPLADSINVSLARFRATDDSSDVYFAAELPVKRMVEDVDLAKGALDVELEAYTWRAKPVFSSTTHETIDFAHPEVRQMQSWRLRLQAGTFLYRIEALQPDAGRGARSASRVELLPAGGFGLSDILVAESLTPNAVDVARWSDFQIAPSIGRVKRGKSFAILWETYDLQKQANGTSSYDVTITLRRAKGGGLGALAAKIVGGVKSAIGISGSGGDKISLTFPRQAPARATTVDYITLDLGDASPGNYVIDVDVTDLANHRHVSRERPLTIVE